MEKTLILGFGNPLMADEGIGIEAVNYLKNNYKFDKNIEIVDGGTSGINIFYHFNNIDNLLIIDAIYYKDKKPGSIVKLSKEDIKNYLKTKISAHDFKVEDFISFLNLIGKMPKNIVIIGIVPEKVEFKYEISETLKKSLPLLVNEILNQIKIWRTKCAFQYHQK